MKDKIKKILFLQLLLMPTMVFADFGEDMTLGSALFMEAFVSIHMSVFVFLPLSRIYSKENSKKLFWTLFFIRVAILLIFDFFITPSIATIDFYAVFIGCFIVVPISLFIKRKEIFQTGKWINTNTINTNIATPIEQIKGIELKCSKCGTTLQLNHKFCAGCGAPFDGNNVVVSSNSVAAVEIPKKESVSPQYFDSFYRLSEDKMLEGFITKELTKCGIDQNTKLIPSPALKRKNILNIIFILLVFIYLSLIFFHFPIATYLIEALILFIYYFLTRRFTLMKYLVKEIKTRPSEKIYNVILGVKNSLVIDNSNRLLIVGLIISIISPLVIFMEPRIIYEKVDNGYAVRYYTFGIKNFTSVSIPEEYKGEKVVSLRGNTFSNMFLLKSVSIPDTVTEIRGQAFKNCYLLKEVNIPKNLEYLGGGAFYNAKSIKRIVLPDTLTYLGGESFYNATSLEYIKLSRNLTEIRGDSFSYCYSLRSIEIPDKVTRIGGHAFYANTSLETVSISKNSQLTEIGSSAFRECYSLKEMIVPERTYINSRAFKESPTIVNTYPEEDDLDLYYNNY